MQWRHGVSHHNTFFFLALLPMKSIFSYLGLSQVNLLFLVFFWIFSFLKPFVASEPRTCRTRHSLGLPLVSCSRQYSNTTCLFGSGAVMPLNYVYYVSNLFVHCTPSRTYCFETCGRKFFVNLWIVFYLLCLSRFWLVSVCQTLAWSSLQTIPLPASWQMEHYF